MCRDYHAFARSCECFIHLADIQFNVWFYSIQQILQTDNLFGGQFDLIPISTMLI